MMTLESNTAHLRDADEALVRVEHLTVRFPVGRRQYVEAVSDVSLDVMPGETVGLVGESGCGKSTTGRAIAQLPTPTSGRVVYDGRDLTELNRKDLRRLRPDLQLIYQDPISSLNPRMTVEKLVGEPLEIWGKGDRAERRARVEAMLDAVGLDPEAVMQRKAGEFSGGQCQRLCIARALVLDPKVLILDEPVSALDVSVQSQILNLLADMRDRYDLTMLLIAHDLAVVRNSSDRVIVMYLGTICEVAPTGSLFDQPAHPYTAGLLAAVPKLSTDAGPSVASMISGELPSPLEPPSGCRFRTRCPHAQERCASETPMLRPIGGNPDHHVACHFPLVEAGT